MRCLLPYDNTLYTYSLSSSTTVSEISLRVLRYCTILLFTVVIDMLPLKKCRRRTLQLVMGKFRETRAKFSPKLLCEKWTFHQTNFSALVSGGYESACVTTAVTVTRPIFASDKLTVFLLRLCHTNGISGNKNMSSLFKNNTVDSNQLADMRWRITTDNQAPDLQRNLSFSPMIDWVGLNGTLNTE